MTRVLSHLSIRCNFKVVGVSNRSIFLFASPVVPILSIIEMHQVRQFSAAFGYIIKDNLYHKTLTFARRLKQVNVICCQMFYFFFFFRKSFLVPLVCPGHHLRHGSAAGCVSVPEHVGKFWKLPGHTVNHHGHRPAAHTQAGRTLTLW